jgi:hypothetical protein
MSKEDGSKATAKVKSSGKPNGEVLNVHEDK